jgi:Flp pilus assembly protein TadD
MARFEKQGEKRAKPHAAVATTRARRAATPPAIEDTMFFPRLRRHAKWMFVFLALVFGLGFVAFGVGAGGVGIGDVFRGSGGDAPSVSSARERTEEHPKDPAAWQELSTTLQAEGDIPGAISAQSELTSLQPKDPDVWRQLAALQISLVSQKQTAAQIIQGNAALQAAGQNFPSLTIGGETLLDDPIGQAINAKAALEVQRLQLEAQAAAAGAVDAYKKVVELQPKDPSVQLGLAQAAQAVGDLETAIGAYERFLVLAPNDPSATAVKQQLAALRAAQS